MLRPAKDLIQGRTRGEDDRRRADPTRGRLFVMKTLLLMRHAKSAWNDPADDHDRPLNKRGMRAAPRMGKLLRELGLVPDFIVSSTAVRAIETARIVAAESGYAGIIREDPSLYLAPPEAYIAAARRLRKQVQRPLLVGHNPGIESLLRLLTAVDLHVPTAAIAKVEMDDIPWSELDLSPRGRLDAFWKPKELPEL